MPENCKFAYAKGDKKASIGDVLQLLSIAYNIGHFHNTFVSSKAVAVYARENEEFKKQILNSFSEERYKMVAGRILEEANYYRLHLLNSLLALQRCDQSKKSVILAQELIYTFHMKRIW